MIGQIPRCKLCGCVIIDELDRDPNDMSVITFSMERDEDGKELYEYVCGKCDNHVIMRPKLYSLIRCRNCKTPIKQKS